MGLKARFEFVGCRNQCKGKFLHGRVSFFGITNRPVSVIHRLLHSFFFFEQGDADDGRGDGQVEEKFFT